VKPVVAPRAAVIHRQPAAVDAGLEAAVADDAVITLAGGVPADELLPAASLGEAMAAVMRDDGPAALQYGWPAGHERLRAWIADWMARRGVRVSPEQILVTSGAQQALCLLGTLLVPEGAPVAVESPTYVAALQALDLRRPRLVPIRRSASGLDLDALDAAFAQGARVLYLTASGHNPTGGVLDAADHAAVIERAGHAGAWIVDDDAYGEIQFGAGAPPLRAHGAHLDRIVHLGSFSKVLAPGLRVGWIAGPPDLIRQATRVKQAQDLETATLSQRVLARWLAHESLEDHVRRCVPVYRQRRDALLAALSGIRANGTWEAPAGGFSLLFRLNAGTGVDLLPRALAAGVAFEPAAPYFADGGGEAAIRLSFSNVSIPAIDLAIRRLAAAMDSSVG
jgi:2-aminoadipate transaminase